MDLKQMRLQKKLTQMQLGELAGVSQSAIASYETRVRKPSPETASRLGKLLGLSIDEMWTTFYGPAIQPLSRTP